ncbi:unnamed protein product [Chondrus crispus]|uniref:Uncharacterized protein n=1 Tax=Chondrus crispus TaxID=2769 RepID=R7Q274_CHOCR|nr:unnamed protein product [Chondrus crispus]CDF32697.1 unnamed protein product [Chondrus crispus]|eukprot:XP_005712468.1 unnamed protein product [Chondrus crispus]
MPCCSSTSWMRLACYRRWSRRPRLLPPGCASSMSARARGSRASSWPSRGRSGTSRCSRPRARRRASTTSWSANWPCTTSRPCGGGQRRSVRVRCIGGGMTRSWHGRWRKCGFASNCVCRWQRWGARFSRKRGWARALRRWPPRRRPSEGWAGSWKMCARRGRGSGWRGRGKRRKRLTEGKVYCGRRKGEGNATGVSEVAGGAEEDAFVRLRIGLRGEKGVGRPERGKVSFERCGREWERVLGEKHTEHCKGRTWGVHGRVARGRAQTRCERHSSLWQCDIRAPRAAGGAGCGTALSPANARRWASGTPPPRGRAGRSAADCRAERRAEDVWYFGGGEQRAWGGRRRRRCMYVRRRGVDMAALRMRSWGRRGGWAMSAGRRTVSGGERSCGEGEARFVII